MGVVADLLFGDAGGRVVPSAASFETFSFADPDLIRQLRPGGGPASGVAVDPFAAMSYSPWFRAHMIVAGDVAKTPLGVFDVADTGGGEKKTPDTGHWAHALFAVRASDEQTAFHFKLLMTAWALSEGDAIAGFYRPQTGPVELIPFLPGDCTPVRQDGELWYIVNVYDRDDAADFTPRKLRPEEVLHVKGLGYDGVCGYDLWWLARETLGNGLASLRSRGSRMRNGGKPGVILETDQALEEKTIKRIRDDWERIHNGIDSNARTAILDRGVKSKTLQFTPEQLAEVQLNEQDIMHVANFTGVPAYKLGSTVAKSFQSLEQEDREYFTGCLDFWFGVWESEANAKAIDPAELVAGRKRVEFNRRKLLWADTRAQAEANRTALAGSGYKTPNEVRAENGYPPHDDPAADELPKPKNMGDAGGGANDPGNPADPPAGRPRGRMAAEKLVRHAAGRLVKRITMNARAAAKDPGKFCEFVDTLRARHGEVFRAEFDAIRPVVREAGGTLMSGPDYLDQLAGRFRGVAETATAARIAAAVEAECLDLEATNSGRLVGETWGE